MRNNPLIPAIELHDEYLTMVINLAEATGADVAKDESIFDETFDLVITAHDAVLELGNRGRRAWLNAIWKDFLEKHPKK